MTGTSGPLPPFPDWLPFTYPWNLTGQPAATVPCGFTRGGLPVGLQIVGRRFADATVLRAAAAFEDAHPWAHKDRKSTRLNSSHRCISYAVFCLKKKKNE